MILVCQVIAGMVKRGPRKQAVAAEEATDGERELVAGSAGMYSTAAAGSASTGTRRCSRWLLRYEGGDDITGRSGDTRTLPLIQRVDSHSPISDSNHAGADLGNG